MTNRKSTSSCYLCQFPYHQQCRYFAYIIISQRNDKKAAEVLQEAFPDREIISIDAQIVIEQHGSLHCLTMQIPQEAEGIL